MEGKVWRPGPTVCRCCLSEGCYKDISTEYFWMGKKEVYADMLSDTFDLSIQYAPTGGPNSQSRLICEPCISRLRDATDFRRQIKECEQTFMEYLNPSTTVDIEIPVELPEKEHKIVSVKVEKPLSDDDDFGDTELLDDDDLDDEPLMNLASKVPKKESVDVTDLIDNAKAEKRKSTTKAKAAPKKAKVKEAKPSVSKAKPEKKKKDFPERTKPIDRRGVAPLLRENSLKLLANSTMVIFQWNKSRYRCFCCKEPFLNISQLRTHTDKHTIQEIEKNIISQQNKLIKVDISVLKCKQCSKALEDLNALCCHLKENHGFATLKNNLLVPFKIESSGLQCQICSQSFNLFRLLNIHVNKHYQNHVCHICGAGFTNLVYLNLHKTRNHRPFRCVQCKIDFKCRIDKRKHDVAIHNIKLERKTRFPCPYCDERFYQENLRVLHLVEKHEMEKPDHKCNLCSKTFVTRSLYNNHVRYVHLKEKNQECDICHSVFYTKSDVTRHRVTHTGEKKFKCNLCNNPFATKDSLRRHVKRTHAAFN
ncbi:zinc finger protein 808 isoform X13 [Pieris rapae]|uniref:zinc finger protein 808 isoform X13 n=1 Tax=Pieris rapae TaxID=64459 RepID=UPI001E28002E|nr:zinc finger protein 808 isoform X13 [Pieris rapae]